MHTRLLLCSLLLSFQAFSQTQPQIDLQLTNEADPPMPWVVGQEGEVRLRVTNLSTPLNTRARINPFLNMFSPPYAGPPRDEFQTLVSIPENCPLDPECQRFGQFCFEVGIIPAGESRFCYARLKALRKREAPNTARYDTYHFENQAIDPDLSNNSVTRSYSILAEPLSVPLSPWTASLLVLAQLRSQKLNTKQNQSLTTH